MAEVPRPPHTEAHKKALDVSAKIAETTGTKVTNPIGRFNNSLPLETHPGPTHTNPNPDWDLRIGAVVHDGEGRTFVNTGGRHGKPSPERKAELVAAAISPSEQIADPETGQKFNVTRGNWDKFRPDTPVTFFLNNLGNENDERESRLRVEALTLQNPNMPFVFIDHPGHGGTDKLTRKQKSTKGSDSYFEVADAMLRVAGEMSIGEDNTLNLTGESLGAFGALALAVRARDHGYNVGKLLLFELPGTQDIGIIKLMLNQLGEFGTLDITHGTPADPELQHATFLDLPPKEKAAADRKAQLHALKMHPIRFARMMAKDTAYDRLTQALAAQPKMEVAFINGSESTISPNDKIYALADRLRGEVDNPQRIGVSMYPGEGHFAIANPDRLGTSMRLLLTPLASEAA